MEILRTPLEMTQARVSVRKTPVRMAERLVVLLLACLLTLVSCARDHDTLLAIRNASVWSSARLDAVWMGSCPGACSAWPFLGWDPTNTYLTSLYVSLRSSLMLMLSVSAIDNPSLYGYVDLFNGSWPPGRFCFRLRRLNVFLQSSGSSLTWLCCTH